ncbi:MAG: hypothetical protein GY817_02690 [bacterium]|nr:hypothetical protein [bacterium]
MFKKNFVSFLLLIFFITSTGMENCFAKSLGSPTPSSFKTDILLGPETGRVVKAHFIDNNNKTVILIKDLHCNLEVQQNTYQILEAVYARYGKKLKNIYVEGAWQDLDINFLQALPELYGIKNTFTDSLMEKGLLSGAEKYAAFNSKIGLKGLEDEQLYREDYNLLVDSYKLREEGNFFIGLILAKVNKDKAKFYKKPLQKIENILQAYKTNQMSIGEYVFKLNDFCNYYSISFKKQAPELYKLYLSQHLKQKIFKIEYVQEDARVFESRILDFLTKEEYQQIWKLKKEEKNTYYLYLQKLSRNKNIPIRGLKSLQDYLNYLNMFVSIDTGRLLADQEVLAYKLLQAASINMNEKELIDVERSLKLYSRFFNNSAIALEVGDVLLNGQVYLDKIHKYLMKYSNDLVWMFALKKTYLSFKEAVKIMRDFYVYADKRNYIFAENIIKANEDVSVAYLGGFHSNEVFDIFKKKNYNCLLIAPNITKETNNDLYEELLLARTSYLQPIQNFNEPNNFQAGLALTSLFQVDGLTYTDLVSRMKMFAEILPTGNRIIDDNFFETLEAKQSELYIIRSKIVETKNLLLSAQYRNTHAPLQFEKEFAKKQAKKFKKKYDSLISERDRLRNEIAELNQKITVDSIKEMMLKIFKHQFDAANLPAEQQLIFYREMQRILPEIRSTKEVTIKYVGDLDATETRLDAIATRLNAEYNKSNPVDLDKNYDEAQLLFDKGKNSDGTWKKPEYKQAFNFVRNYFTNYGKHKVAIQNCNEIAYDLIGKAVYTGDDLTLARLFLADSDISLHKAAYRLVLSSFVNDGKLDEHELLDMSDYFKENSINISNEKIWQIRELKLIANMNDLDSNYKLTKEDLEMLEANDENLELKENIKQKVFNSLESEMHKRYWDKKADYTKLTELDKYKLEVLNFNNHTAYKEVTKERLNHKFKNDQKLQVDDYDITSASFLEEEKYHRKIAELLKAKKLAGLTESQINFLKAKNEDIYVEMLIIDMFDKFYESFDYRIIVKEDVDFSEKDQQNFDFLTQYIYQKGVDDYHGEYTENYEKFSFIALIKMRANNQFDDHAVIAANKFYHQLENELILLPQEEKIFDLVNATRLIGLNKKKKNMLIMEENESIESLYAEKNIEESFYFFIKEATENIEKYEEKSSEEKSSEKFSVESSILSLVNMDVNESKMKKNKNIKLHQIEEKKEELFEVVAKSKEEESLDRSLISKIKKWFDFSDLEAARKDIDNAKSHDDRKAQINAENKVSIYKLTSKLKVFSAFLYTLILIGFVALIFFPGFFIIWMIISVLLFVVFISIFFELQIKNNLQYQESRSENIEISEKEVNHQLFFKIEDRKEEDTKEEDTKEKKFDISLLEGIIETNGIFFTSYQDAILIRRAKEIVNNQNIDTMHATVSPDKFLYVFINGSDRVEVTNLNKRAQVLPFRAVLGNKNVSISANRQKIGKLGEGKTTTLLLGGSQKLKNFKPRVNKTNILNAIFILTASIFTFLCFSLIVVSFIFIVVSFIFFLLTLYAIYHFLSITMCQYAVFEEIISFEKFGDNNKNVDSNIIVSDSKFSDFEVMDSWQPISEMKVSFDAKADEFDYANRLISEDSFFISQAVDIVVKNAMQHLADKEIENAEESDLVKLDLLVNTAIKVGDQDVIQNMRVIYEAWYLQILKNKKGDFTERDYLFLKGVGELAIFKHKIDNFKMLELMVKLQDRTEIEKADLEYIMMVLDDKYIGIEEETEIEVTLLDIRMLDYFFKEGGIDTSFLPYLKMFDIIQGNLNNGDFGEVEIAFMLIHLDNNKDINNFKNNYLTLLDIRLSKIDGSQDLTNIEIDLLESIDKSLVIYSHAMRYIFNELKIKAMENYTALDLRKYNILKVYLQKVNLDESNRKMFRGLIDGNFFGERDFYLKYFKASTHQILNLDLFTLEDLVDLELIMDYDPRDDLGIHTQSVKQFLMNRNIINKNWKPIGDFMDIDEIFKNSLPETIIDIVDKVRSVLENVILKHEVLKYFTFKVADKVAEHENRADIEQFLSDHIQSMDVDTQNIYSNILGNLELTKKDVPEASMADIKNIQIMIDMRDREAKEEKLDDFLYNNNEPGQFGFGREFAIRSIRDRIAGKLTEDQQRYEMIQLLEVAKIEDGYLFLKENLKDFIEGLETQEEKVEIDAIEKKEKFWRTLKSIFIVIGVLGFVSGFILALLGGQLAVGLAVILVSALIILRTGLSFIRNLPSTWLDLGISVILSVLIGLFVLPSLWLILATTLVFIAFAVFNYFNKLKQSKISGLKENKIIEQKRIRKLKKQMTEYLDYLDNLDRDDGAYDQLDEERLEAKRNRKVTKIIMNINKASAVILDQDLSPKELLMIIKLTDYHRKKVSAKASVADKLRPMQEKDSKFFTLGPLLTVALSVFGFGLLLFLNFAFPGLIPAIIIFGGGIAVSLISFLSFLVLLRIIFKTFLAADVAKNKKMQGILISVSAALIVIISSFVIFGVVYGGGIPAIIFAISLFFFWLNSRNKSNQVILARSLENIGILKRKILKEGSNKVINSLTPLEVMELDGYELIGEDISVEFGSLIKNVFKYNPNMLRILLVDRDIQDKEDYVLNLQNTYTKSNAAYQALKLVFKFVFLLLIISLAIYVVSLTFSVAPGLAAFGFSLPILNLALATLILTTISYVNLAILIMFIFAYYFRKYIYNRVEMEYLHSKLTRLKVADNEIKAPFNLSGFEQKSLKVISLKLEEITKKIVNEIDRANNVDDLYNIIERAEFLRRFGYNKFSKQWNDPFTKKAYDIAANYILRQPVNQASTAFFANEKRDLGKYDKYIRFLDRILMTNSALNIVSLEMLEDQFGNLDELTESLQEDSNLLAFIYGLQINKLLEDEQDPGFSDSYQNKGKFLHEKWNDNKAEIENMVPSAPSEPSESSKHSNSSGFSLDAIPDLLPFHNIVHLAPSDINELELFNLKEAFKRFETAVVNLNKIDVSNIDVSNIDVSNNDNKVRNAVENIINEVGEKNIKELLEFQDNNSNVLNLIMEALFDNKIQLDTAIDSIHFIILFFIMNGGDERLLSQYLLKYLFDPSIADYNNVENFVSNYEAMEFLFKTYILKEDFEESEELESIFHDSLNREKKESTLYPESSIENGTLIKKPLFPAPTAPPEPAAATDSMESATPIVSPTSPAEAFSASPTNFLKPTKSYQVNTDFEKEKYYSSLLQGFFGDDFVEIIQNINDIDDMNSLVKLIIFYNKHPNQKKAFIKKCFAVKNNKYNFIFKIEEHYSNDRRELRDQVAKKEKNKKAKRNEAQSDVEKIKNNIFLPAFSLYYKSEDGFNDQFKEAHLAGGVVVSDTANGFLNNGNRYGYIVTGMNMFKKLRFLKSVSAIRNQIQAGLDAGINYRSIRYYVDREGRFYSGNLIIGDLFVQEIKNELAKLSFEFDLPLEEVLIDDNSNVNISGDINEEIIKYNKNLQRKDIDLISNISTSDIKNIIEADNEADNEEYKVEVLSDDSNDETVRELKILIPSNLVQDESDIVRVIDEEEVNFNLENIVKLSKRAELSEIIEAKEASKVEEDEVFIIKNKEEVTLTGEEFDVFAHVSTRKAIAVIIARNVLDKFSSKGLTYKFGDKEQEYYETLKAVNLDESEYPLINLALNTLRSMRLRAKFLNKKNVSITEADIEDFLALKGSDVLFFTDAFRLVANRVDKGIIKFDFGNAPNTNVFRRLLFESAIYQGSYNAKVYLPIVEKDLQTKDEKIFSDVFKTENKKRKWLYFNIFMVAALFIGLIIVMVSLALEIFSPILMILGGGIIVAVIIGFISLRFLKNRFKPAKILPDLQVFISSDAELGEVLDATTLISKYSVEIFYKFAAAVKNSLGDDRKFNPITEEVMKLILPEDKQDQATEIIEKLKNAGMINDVGEVPLALIDLDEVDIEAELKGDIVTLLLKTRLQFYRIEFITKFLQLAEEQLEKNYDKDSDLKFNLYLADFIMDFGEVYQDRIYQFGDYLVLKNKDKNFDEEQKILAKENFSENSNIQLYSFLKKYTAMRIDTMINSWNLNLFTLDIANFLKEHGDNQSNIIAEKVDPRVRELQIADNKQDIVITRAKARLEANLPVSQALKKQRNRKWLRWGGGGLFILALIAVGTILVLNIFIPIVSFSLFFGIIFASSAGGIGFFLLLFSLINNLPKYDIDLDVDVTEQDVRDILTLKDELGAKFFKPVAEKALAQLRDIPLDIKEENLQSIFIEEAKRKEVFSDLLNLNIIEEEEKGAVNVVNNFVDFTEKDVEMLGIDIYKEELRDFLFYQSITQDSLAAIFEEEEIRGKVFARLKSKNIITEHVGKFYLSDFFVDFKDSDFDGLDLDGKEDVLKFFLLDNRHRYYLYKLIEELSLLEDDSDTFSDVASDIDDSLNDNKHEQTHSDIDVAAEFGEAALAGYIILEKEGYEISEIPKAATILKLEEALCIDIKVINNQDKAIGLFDYNHTWYLTNRDMKALEFADNITQGGFTDRLIEHEQAEGNALNKYKHLPFEEALKYAHADALASTQTMDELLYIYINRLFDVQKNADGGVFNLAEAGRIMSMMLDQNYDLEELFKTDYGMRQILEEEVFKAKISGGEKIIETNGRTFAEIKQSLPQNLKGFTIVFRGGIKDFDDVLLQMITFVKDRDREGATIKFAVDRETLPKLLDENRPKEITYLINMGALSVLGYFEGSDGLVLPPGKVLGLKAYEYAKNYYKNLKDDPLKPKKFFNKDTAAYLIDQLVMAELQNTSGVEIISLLEEYDTLEELDIESVPVLQFVISGKEKALVNILDGLEPKVVIKIFNQHDAEELTVNIGDGADLNIQNGNEEVVTIQGPFHITADDLSFTKKVILIAAHASDSFMDTITLLGGPVVQLVLLPLAAKFRRERGFSSEEVFDQESVEQIKQLAAAA